MMNHRLKIVIFSTLLCFSGGPLLSHQNPPSLINNHGEDATKNLDFDWISFDDEDGYQDMNEFFDTVAMDHMSRAINPVDVMMLLNLFKIPPILQFPFFLHTNFLNKRSLFHQPIFEPDRPEFPGKWVVGSSLFARKAYRSYFTKDSDKLSSYLAIT